MKPIQKLILVLAAIWIIVKVLLFTSGKAVDWFQVSVSLNIGFTLFIMFRALAYHYSTYGKPSDFVKDFTVSLKAAAQYSLIIFGFLAIYYLYIDPGFGEAVAENRLNELKLKVGEEGGYAAFMEKYKSEMALPESAADITEVEYYTQVKDGFMQMMSTKILLPLMFMGLFFMNMACAGIFSGVYKRFFLRR